MMPHLNSARLNTNEYFYFFKPSTVFVLLTMSQKSCQMFILRSRRANAVPSKSARLCTQAPLAPGLGGFNLDKPGTVHMPLITGLHSVVWCWIQATKPISELPRSLVRRLSWRPA